MADDGQMSTRMVRRQTAIFSAVLFAISILLGLGALEIALRLKNSAMTNYDIEMWRYSKELKVRSENPALGHVHLKSRSAVLQSVVIRTNEWGLRGGPQAQYDKATRRILFLGGSITLGWGVHEEDTVTVRLQRMLQAKGEKVEVLNGGVGNYNAQRYVERFFQELKGLNPDDIVVQFFLRDAEYLDPGRDNFILRNSQLAVTTWIAASRLLNRTGEASLYDHYVGVYKESEPGYGAMRESLKKLAEYARQNNIRIYLAMTPDVHNLKDYQFEFVHQRMKIIADEFGYQYVDLLPAFRGLSPKEVWAMPGDPHPNSLGHKLMAEAILPILASGK